MIVYQLLYVININNYYDLIECMHDNDVHNNFSIETNAFPASRVCVRIQVDLVFEYMYFFARSAIVDHLPSTVSTTTHSNQMHTTQPYIKNINNYT